MRSRLWLCFLILIGGACRSSIEVPLEANPERAVSGSLRSVSGIGHYPALKSRALFWWVGLSDALPVAHGVRLYRVEYWTTDPAGRRAYASGLVALPSTAAFRGIVSYQHPTRTERTNVPSTPSRTALLAAIAFAGHGYVLAAPDYLGLGTSPGLHPYLHAASEASSVIDLLRAARLLVRHKGHEWPQALFLTGFSQGGHATLAAQRALEENPVDGLRVTASAPVAGTYNLSRIQFPFALEGHSESHPAYLGYMTTAYAHIYGESLTSAVIDPYGRDLPELFDGSRPLKEVAAALPQAPAEMFRPEFLGAFAAGEGTWLGRALALNDVVDWTPQAPVRFYYGTRDQDSPPADTLSTVEHMRRRGGAVSAVNVGENDHSEVVYLAVPRIRAWFDQFAPPACCGRSREASGGATVSAEGAR